MLHERRDFVDLLATVGQRAGASVALIEKDYWVSESLRAIAANFDDGVVFKGGTSLSKGYGLINRFSEDIDLLIVPETAGLKSIASRDRYMKEIAGSVSSIDGLAVREGAGRANRGTSRTVIFDFEPRAPQLLGLEASVILEMGIRGGPNPHQRLPLNSMLGAALLAGGNTSSEAQPFKLDVLDPKRTLVEKLSALHSGCVRWSEGDDRALNRISRHYTDIDSLLANPDILIFIESPQYQPLIAEVQEISAKNFPDTHRAVESGRFSESPALAPRPELFDELLRDFEENASIYYQGVPDLTQVIERLLAIKHLL